MTNNERLKKTRVELMVNFAASQAAGIKAGVHEIIDLKTMKSFRAFIGGISSGYHTDWSPNSPDDVKLLQSIGSWNWNARPGVLVLPNGRFIACGFHMYPHGSIIGGKPGAPLSSQSNTRPANGWPIGGHMCMYFGYQTGGGMNDSMNPQAREAKRIGDSLFNGATATATAPPASTTAVPSGLLDRDVIAREVIAGKWGNGDARKTALANAGYNYNQVQSDVNTILNKGTVTGPSVGVPVVTTPTTPAPTTPKYPICPQFVDGLASLGIISDTTYWKKVDNLQWLNELLETFCKPGIIVKGRNNAIDSFETALTMLVNAKVINSPDYWRKAVKDKVVTNLDTLIIKVANSTNFTTCPTCTNHNV